MPALSATRADVISPVRVTALSSEREVIRGEGREMTSKPEMTSKTLVALAALVIAGLIVAPAAGAGPAPTIDWSDLLDEAVDEDLEVGEEMC